MNSNYERAFNMLCQYEGFTSDLKGDAGGYTIWGITERWYPKDVEAMMVMTPQSSKEYAKTFYKREFWDKAGCDNLPLPIDIITFDTAVNCGLHAAKKMLVESKNDWKDYIYRRLFYYSILVKEKPDQLKFLRGWLNRCLSLWMQFKDISTVQAGG